MIFTYKIELTYAYLKQFTTFYKKPYKSFYEEMNETSCNYSYTNLQLYCYAEQVKGTYSKT